jgi:hypothetical protein
MGEITYFEEKQQRMRYDLYRAMQVPIGSGTVESSCKNVIRARMKHGGMTWSESGAEEMLGRVSPRVPTSSMRSRRWAGS